MAVRFKFRSSVNIDSVAIGEQPSISVGDLKSRILLRKNLNVCQDFDLVFSDASTGQEYVDDDFQIPNGSCVIIKRVPAGTTHTDKVQLGSFKDFQSQPTKAVNSSPPMNIDMNELDGFGVDLYSVRGATTSPCDLDNNLRIQDYKTHIDTESFSEPFKGECHKFGVSDLSEATAGGAPHAGTSGNTSELKSKIKNEDYTKVEKVMKATNPSLQKIDLPSELKCPICDSIFKDAMMIPCCQHSFCEKCVSLVLVETRRCPKCYSTRCTVENLLPNVTLRQAIEHFLASGSCNAFHQYASDEESEAHAKDVFCDVIAYQKGTDSPHSPSPTETGSNEIVGEATHDILLKENTSLRCNGSHFAHLATKPFEKGQILKEKHPSACTDEVGGYNSNLGKWQLRDKEGIILCLFTPAPKAKTYLSDGIAVELTSREKGGLRFNTIAAGGDKRLMNASGHRKGSIICYMCGSPYHLMRECPVTSGPYPMPQRGVAMLPQSVPSSVSPFWNMNFFYQVGPSTTQYGNQGMIPFNMAMFPGGPYSLPTYMHPSGPMKIGGMAFPLGMNSDLQVSGSEFLDLHNCNKSQKLSSDTKTRANAFDNDDLSKRHLQKHAERSHPRKSYLTREKSTRTYHNKHHQLRKRKHSCRNDVDDEIAFSDEKNSHSSNGSKAQRSCWHPEE